MRVRRIDWQSAGFSALCIFVFIRILLNTVVIDDPYITFRVVDNFVHGYGLRWNIDERVQVYTHPLWMLLHIPFYWLVGNIYWVTIVLSLIFGVLTCTMLLRLRPDATLLAKSCLVLIPLVASRTFRNYVICGLENPLNFFLFAWLMVELLRPWQVFPLYRVALIISLLMVTRFDNGIVLVPLLIVVALKEWKNAHVGKLFLATSPFWLWYGFSLFYYGFFFPNTKYTKMHMGVEPAVYIQHGLMYLYNFSYGDPLAFVWVAAAFLSAVCVIGVAFKNGFNLERKETIILLIGLGLPLHVCYVISFGGDFMPGRFFSNLFILAIGIIFFLHGDRFMRIKYQAAALLLAFIAADQFLLQPRLPNRGDQGVNYGIDDQHDYYYPFNGLTSQQGRWLRLEPEGYRVDRGRSERAGTERPVFMDRGSDGASYYYAGPYIIAIDLFGLTDALIARLPVRDPHGFRVGHADRHVPRGYVYARETGDLSPMDPDLARYYDKLRLVIQGDLFSLERLRAIIGFQLGEYDHWRDVAVNRGSY